MNDRNPPKRDWVVCRFRIQPLRASTPQAWLIRFRIIAIWTALKGSFMLWKVGDSPKKEEQQDVKRRCA